MSRSRGILVVLAGPSGAGKTTLAHHLVDTFESAVFSVSTTTRKLRGSEREGFDYCFVSRNFFQERLSAGFFLEWAEVHGQLYGTSREWVSNKLSEGRHVVLDIDVQGSIQVKSAFPEAVLIFVLPPSPDILNRRLITRSTDDTGVVQDRLETAAWETGWIGLFDYFISNDKLEDSLSAVESILRGESRRLSNLPFPPEARSYEPRRFEGRGYWNGRKVIVTSGPSREYLDEVRFISNRSSGLMGQSLAESFRDAGADVLFISGPACRSLPCGVRRRSVVSADEMLSTIRSNIDNSDFLVMTAAVSDFKPATRVVGKMRRSGEIELKLEATPDILASLKEIGGGTCPFLAFALEMGRDGENRARRKMQSKGAIAIFYNRGDIPGSGMDAPGNEGKLIFEDGTSETVKSCSKRYAAELIVASMGRYMQKEVDDTRGR